MAPGWNGAKTKVQLKLTAQRCSLLQEKKNAIAKKERREIASLIERGKLETARVKTEGIIGEDIMVELLEIMELYSEMLIARFALLELNQREPDPAIKEPLCAIIHAAPRIELREMHALREMLMAKYGREFAVAAMENTDGCVSERVTSRLRVETPSKELVDMYIAEICKAYDVEFHSPYLETGPDDLDKIPDPLPHAAAEGPLPAQPLSKNVSAATKSDLEIAAATGTIETGTQESAMNKTTKSASATTGNSTPQSSNTKNDEDKRVDDLEARFAALKRR
jgi:vacuolar protein sorting-associated protein IST1